MLDYQSFIGLKKTNIETEMDFLNENLKRKGFHIIENFITPEQVTSLRNKILSSWEIQKDKYGEDHLIKIGDFGVCRGLIEYDSEFLKLLTSNNINMVLKATIGETAILHLQNGIVLFPDLKHNQARYHRDFPKTFISSELLSINIFILLDEFTAANGGTYLVPNSHHISEMPSEKYIEQNQIQIEAPAGSAVIFDSMLWHKGGMNSTQKPRLAMNNQFTKAFIKQQLNYPEMMKGKIDIESKEAQRIGMWAVPPRSVDEYRVKDPALRTYRAGQG